MKMNNAPLIPDVLIACWLEKDIKFQKLHNPFTLNGSLEFKKWWDSVGIYHYKNAVLELSKTNKQIGIFEEKYSCMDSFIKNKNLMEILQEVDSPFLSESLKIKVLSYLLNKVEGLFEFINLIINENEYLLKSLKDSKDKISWWINDGINQNKNILEHLDILLNKVVFFNLIDGNEKIFITRGIFVNIYNNYGLIFEGNDLTLKNVSRTIIRLIDDLENYDNEISGIFIKKDIIESDIQLFLANLIFNAREDLIQTYKTTNTDFFKWFNDYGSIEYSETIKKFKKIIHRKNDLTRVNLNPDENSDINLIGIKGEISGLSIEYQNIFNELNKIQKVNQVFFKNQKILPKNLKFSKSIFVGSPYSLIDLTMQLEKPFMADSIAYLPWEFEHIDINFSKFLPKEISQIWTTSNFSKKAFEPFFSKIKVLPCVIDYKNLKQINGRDYFGLVNNKYYFLSVFDGFSSLIRKNPYTTIEAFRKLSKKYQNIGLVIKTHNLTNFELNSFKEKCLDLEVIFLNSTIPMQSYYDLICCIDCAISTHRCEGFGRFMAEAMYLEKPVIASGYSGNLDFMNEENSYLIEGKEIYLDEFSYQGVYLPNQYKWFEPSCESTIDQMERCINDKCNDLKLRNAKEDILRKYSIKSLNKFLNENL